MNIFAFGKIEGHLLNQFSMDEYEEYLRVAVTISSLASDLENFKIEYIQ